MKKIVSVLLVLVLTLAFVSTLTACAPREEVLRIYNWGEYISEDISADDFADFVAYYKDVTGGKNITVEYMEFSTNEDMYTEIKEKRSDYDLVCPSDYMIDKMRSANLLLPLGDEVDLDPIDESLLDIASAFDPGNVYAVPYMWGTFGIMYDKTKVTEADMASWSAIFSNTKYKDRVYMKNSVRDAFASASIYANRDALASAKTAGTYEDKLMEVINDTSSENIDRVKQVLTYQRENVLFKYENDEGKTEMMTAAASAGWLGLFWSCDAGYAMSDPDGRNDNLRYVIPDEGSNVYVDAFVIPKYAGNPSAARHFLNYLNQTEVAYANMEYVGSASGVKEANEEYESWLNESDCELFMVGGKLDAELQQNFIDTLFPSSEVLARCAVMTDFGDKSAAINEMFISVKGGGGGNDDCGEGAQRSFMLITGLVVILFVKRLLVK